MADAAKRSSANTTIFIGTLNANIGLFGTNAKPAGLPGFETAGPNGGKLKHEDRAVPAPIEAGQEEAVEAGSSDPLATSEPTVATSEPTVIDHVDAVHGVSIDLPSDPLASTGGGGALVPGEFRQVLVEEGSGEVVKKADVRRGVRLDDGRFIDCTDQLDAIEGRTKLDRMDVVAFIDSTRIRRQRVVGAFFVGAQDNEAAPVLKLLHETLKRRREVAVVKYTVRSRQQLGVIEADVRSGTLNLLSLVWSEDWRAAPPKALTFQAVKWRDDATFERHVGAMGALAEAMHGTVDVLDEVRDDAVALRQELLARALAGEMDASVVEALPEAKPVDLADALEASLTAVRGGKL